MANQFYPKGAQKLMSAAINLAADTIKVALVPSTYTFSTAHEFLSDLGTSVGTDQTLANKSVAGGVFDADDAEFGAIASGNTIKAAVIYKSTGSAATSPLLCFIDEVVGFPVATNGGEQTVRWSDGSAKIISLLPA